MGSHTQNCFEPELSYSEGNALSNIGSHVESISLFLQVDLLTTIIFTTSVQHSVVNFQQYDQYKYIPNSPTAMRLPPHKRGEVNAADRIAQSFSIGVL